jgi:hypothetical protein
MQVPQGLRAKIRQLKQRVSQSMTATGGHTTNHARRLQRRLARAAQAAKRIRRTKW